MKKIAIVAGALALGALTAGCGDDKKDGAQAPTDRKSVV